MVRMGTMGQDVSKASFKLLLRRLMVESVYVTFQTKHYGLKKGQKIAPSTILNGNWAIALNKMNKNLKTSPD